MEQILNDYYADNAKKLHSVVDKIIRKKYGGTMDKDMTEFYSVANDVFADIIKRDRYDSSKGDFDGFLYGALDLAIIDEFKRQNRDKRKAKIEVEIDGEMKRVPVQDVYLDAPVGEDEDSATIGDTIQLDYSLENDVFKCAYDNKIEKYLNGLSKIQRKIVEMKMDGVPVSEIKQKLGLSENAYKDNMQLIRQNKMTSLFNKNNRTVQSAKMGNIKMKDSYEVNVDDVMDIDTTDSYRTDKYPLGSLLDDLSLGYIDRNYISQRQPFQWSDDQVNKFYSRLLNNQPIPEIVICEKTEDGEKVAYLIDGLQRLTYAEEFKENRIPVKAKGAEFINIKYKKRIVDEDGKTRFEVDTFNIVGKYYKDLPEFLQKRFDKFNVTVTRFFNCTSEMIDYHMRNYNNHTSMTKSQYGITNVSNATSRNIKTISEKHAFFKDNISCTNKNRKKGVLDETVARTIMTINFIDDWKKELMDVLKYIDKNATTEQFEHLKDNLDRLSKVANDSVKDLFTTTNTPIWLAVFDKFIEFDLPDDKFVEFMKEFKDSLHNKEVNGESFDLTYKNRNTRDKKVVIAKIESLYQMMLEFLHINKEDIKKIDVVNFVKENVDADITEDDVKQYEEVLDDLTLNVDNSSKLMNSSNRPSLVAMVAYSFKNDVDLDNWIVWYFNHNDTYLKKQDDNYKSMVNDLNTFVKNDSKAGVM